MAFPLNEVDDVLKVEFELHWTLFFGQIVDVVPLTLLQKSWLLNLTTIQRPLLSLLFETSQLFTSTN